MTLQDNRPAVIATEQIPAAYTAIEIAAAILNGQQTENPDIDLASVHFTTDGETVTMTARCGELAPQFRVREQDGTTRPATRDDTLDLLGVPPCTCPPAQIVGSGGDIIDQAEDPACPRHGEPEPTDAAHDAAVAAALAGTRLAGPCPSCHQLPGRPPTEYCQNPENHYGAHPEDTP